MDQLYKTRFPLLKAACIDHRHRAAAFSDDQDARFTRKSALLLATTAEMEAMRVHFEDSRAFHIGTCRQPHNIYGISHSDARKAEVENRGTLSGMGLLITSVP